MSGRQIAPRVLVVEDDAELSAMLVKLLTAQGYEPEAARDGHTGLHLGLSGGHHAMIVDRGLPAIEGVDLIRRLRANSVTTPILVLTAHGTVEDRIEGLDAGAEDYLVKPFMVGELLARLRALLRRHGDEAETLQLGESMLLVAQRRVIGGEREPVDLSPREAALLCTLARRPQRVFSRDELLERVFDAADAPGSVDTYVHYLRRKLGRGVVRTVRGSGYRMGSA